MVHGVEQSSAYISEQTLGLRFPLD